MAVIGVIPVLGFLHTNSYLTSGMKIWPLFAALHLKKAVVAGNCRNKVTQLSGEIRKLIFC